MSLNNHGGNGQGRELRSKRVNAYLSGPEAADAAGVPRDRLQEIERWGSKTMPTAEENLRIREAIDRLVAARGER